MDKIAIIASSQDPAGINIRNNLIELFDFEKINEKFDDNDVFQYIDNNNQIKLFLTNNELVHSENIDERIDSDILIFASKHRSKENTPSFAVHSIGNWHEAYLGGQNGKLCMSSAVLLKNLFLELNENAKSIEGYDITLEATHHGPYVSKPSVFVEIGSTEKEWNDKLNGEIIAKTIMNGLKNENKNYESYILIGGGHYNQAANKIMLRTNYAVGHICPKYALEYLDEDMIIQAINKTIPTPNIVLLDWKGLGKEKQKIISMLNNLNLEFKRTDKLS